MKITLDELIEHSFCIACNNEDYERFAEDFKKKLGVDKAPRMFRGFVFHIGFYPALGIYTARRNRRLELGCGLAHYYVLKAARHLGWPYVGVFEDDFCFTHNDSRKVVDELLDNIPDDTDIAKFHCCVYNSAAARLRYKDTVPTDEKRYDIPKCWSGNPYGWGTQGYIEFSKSYDKRVYGIETHNLIADWESFQDIAGSQLHCIKPSVELGRQGILRASSRSIDLKVDTKKGDPHEGVVEASAATHVLHEKEFGYYGYESLFQDPTQRHAKTYAARTYIGLLGCVKTAESLGWGSVCYETARGRYTVKADDYLKVQKTPDFNLAAAYLVDGVKYDSTERDYSLSEAEIYNNRCTEALSEGLKHIKECTIL